MSLVQDEIAKQLGFTQQEEKRLEQELVNAIYGKELTELIEVTLVQQSEVETKLPLHIVPQPDHLYRIHLVLKPVLSSEIITAPTLAPIDRSGFTVVELGARVEN